jgi:two-component system sensor histidine kinase PilS (NtrC family)
MSGLALRNSTRDRLYLIYIGYRVLLAMILLGILFTGQVGIGQDHSLHLALITGGIYLGLTLFSLRFDKAPTADTLNVYAIIDVLVLLLFILWSEPSLLSPLTQLLLGALVLANTLVTGVRGYAIVAIATLGLLGIAVFDSAGEEDSLFVAAMTGALYFASAVLFQKASGHLANTEKLVRRQASSLSQLQDLNQIVVQAIDRGLILIDRNQRIRMTNQQADNMLGRRPAEGESLEKTSPALANALATWRADEEARPESFPLVPDTVPIQPLFWLLGEENGHVLILLENCERILKHAQDLKLSSLGRLSASIAHEIRNPLNAVSQASEMLRELATKDEDVRNLGDIIHRHTLRMNKIVTSVQQLSRRSPPAFSDISLGRWLSNWLVHVDSMWPQPHQVLHNIPEHISVRFDETHLEQVLINLISNGITYAAASGKTPTVNLRASILPGTHNPCLDVIDNGPGVPEEEIPHLFEPFHSTRPQGTGLGLYITRDLCEANYAQLIYVGRPRGNGAYFRIVFSHPYRSVV